MCGNPIKDGNVRELCMSLSRWDRLNLYTTVPLDLPVQCVTLCLLSHEECDCESVMTLYPLTLYSIHSNSHTNWVLTGPFYPVHASVLCPLEHRDMWNVVSHSEALWEVEMSLVFAGSSDWTDTFWFMCKCYLLRLGLI